MIGNLQLDNSETLVANKIFTSVSGVTGNSVNVCVVAWFLRLEQLIFKEHYSQQKSRKKCLYVF